MTKRKPCVVGCYRFTGKVLGKGNFARVEEACHEILGVKVAVKIMDLNSIKEDYVVRNLFREAKIMAKLKHPCIVSLFETMQKSDNIYYLVTEIVTGGDLCTYVKAQRAGKLDEKITKFFAQQFVSALSYMHHKGIVHRDLKMENVMLNSAQNQIKIVDFGLSNEWSVENPLKTHCGSPEYAAPELFVTSKVYGPEVDVWSLGIILYGMVVGQLPFVSTKTPSITSQERRKLLVAQINKGISGPQRKLIAMFSFEFRSLMNRLLSADSKKRITIKEMTVHPWITDNGKKFVRMNPTRKITAMAHNKIMDEISTLLCKKTSEINRLIREDPLGTEGGMYNILVHKTMMKTFNPELVTRCTSETLTYHLGRKKEDLSVTPQRLIQTAREGEEGKFRTYLKPHTMINACDDMSRTKTILTTRTPLLKHNFSLSSGESIPKEVPSAKCKRPKSVQITRSHNVNEERRPMTSALHKRQEYSANLASRFGQQYTPKTSKSKNEKEELQEITMKKHIEIMQKLMNTRAKETSEQLIKLSASNASKRTPRLLSKCSGNDRHNKSTKSSTPKTTSKNPSANIATFSNSFIQYISQQKEHFQISPKGTSQKTDSTSFRKMDVEPRKTPARMKLKAKRPVPSHSSGEIVDHTPRRVVPVSEMPAKSSPVTCSEEFSRQFSKAHHELSIITKEKNNKIVHSIPANRYGLVLEPKPGSARGDYNRISSEVKPRRTNSSNIPSQTEDSKISKNILNYLKRDGFH